MQTLLNPVTGDAVNVLAHPWFPQGGLLAASEATAPARGQRDGMPLCRRCSGLPPNKLAEYGYAISSVNVLDYDACFDCTTVAIVHLRHSRRRGPGPVPLGLLGLNATTAHTVCPAVARCLHQGSDRDTPVRRFTAAGGHLADTLPSFCRGAGILPRSSWLPRGPCRSWWVVVNLRGRLHLPGWALGASLLRFLRWLPRSAQSVDEARRRPGATGWRARWLNGPAAAHNTPVSGPLATGREKSPETTDWRNHGGGSTSLCDLGWRQTGE